jgi:hypothetical protein
MIKQNRRVLAFFLILFYSIGSIKLTNGFSGIIDYFRFNLYRITLLTSAGELPGTREFGTQARQQKNWGCRTPWNQGVPPAELLGTGELGGFL